ncbi:ESPL1 protein, partial [Menura novaehollandiae]|nr:ESPL1 protein [Menura novaehollandiae]
PSGMSPAPGVPSGVTVCQLSLASARPGGLGDIPGNSFGNSFGNALILTRLQRDRDPISIRIPTEQSQAPLGSVLRELESIQREQREANGCTDRQEWWTRRSRLDLRMKSLIQSLESQVLGCWRGLLLPSPPGNPPLDEESLRLLPELRECGWE